MKIRGFTRFMLRLFAFFATLIGLAGAALMACFALNLDWPHPGETHAFLVSNLWITISACAFFLIFAVFGLRFLFLRKPYESPTLLLKTTEHGAIVIALSALDSMVLRAARKISGLRDVQTRVVGIENTLSVRLKVSLMPDVSVPEATTELQSAIKAYVEETSGILVRDIQVFVDSVQQAAPARVE